MTVDPDLPLTDVIAEIVRINAEIELNWKNSWEWAPDQTARLLDESRLDWLVSMSHTLGLWIVDEVPSNQFDGRLILAWANLGSLVEGTMKFFLSVYASNYSDTVNRNRADSIFKKLWDNHKGQPKEVDGLMLDVLREFFRNEIWIGPNKSKWDAWVAHIRDRRNTIHAYRDRDLGTFEEFFEDVRTYLEFLAGMAGRLPPPPCQS